MAMQRSSKRLHPGSRWLVGVTLVVLFALGSQGPAQADMIYQWQTLSATFNGSPTNGFSAFGQIVLTDSALAAGQASIATTNPEWGSPQETLNGVASANFGFTFGPNISTPLGVIDFAASPDGQYLKISPDNLYGGFFVNGVDTEAYFAVSAADSDVLTVGYGTDNASSPCWGAQEPSLSRCVVTGEFVLAGDPPAAAPEPGALSIFAGALIVLATMRGCQRKRPTRDQTINSRHRRGCDRSHSGIGGRDDVGCRALSGIA